MRFFMILIALLLSQFNVGIGTMSPRLLNELTYHMSSTAVEARYLYSVSAVDLDIVTCFFASQDMRLGLIKIAKLIVDLRSSWELAQSVSQYPVKVANGLLT